MEERRVTQRRVHKRRRPQRRVQDEAHVAQRRTGQRSRVASNAKIYEWLNLPTWRE